MEYSGGEFKVESAVPKKKIGDNCGIALFCVERFEYFVVILEDHTDFGVEYWCVPSFLF